jgi:hypothetical protein
VKLAVDPGFATMKFFGIASDFRNRVYPCAVVGTTAKNFPTPATPTVLACGDGSTTPSAVGAYNDSRFAGGLGVSAKLHFAAKKLDIGVKALAGDGIGRYGSAQLPDATARPDGTLAPIKGLTLPRQNRMPCHTQVGLLRLLRRRVSRSRRLHGIQQRQGSSTLLQSQVAET